MTTFHKDFIFQQMCTFINAFTLLCFLKFPFPSHFLSSLKALLIKKSFLKEAFIWKKEKKSINIIFKFLGYENMAKYR